MQLNSVEYSTIKNYISGLRQIIIFIRESRTYNKYINTSISIATQFNAVAVFIDCIHKIHLKEDFIDIFWDFVLHKITMAQRKVQRNTVPNYWSAAQFFFQLYTSNTPYETPKLTKKALGKLKRMLPHYHQAADPLDSPHTVSTFVQEGINSTAIDENLYFYAATWFGFLAVLRPSEAYRLTQDNFTFFDQNEEEIKDIDSPEISKLLITIFQYKNRYHIDDTKTIMLDNWPQARILNPLHMCKILLKNQGNTNHLANAYKTWHGRWKTFWKRHPEKHAKNYKRKITVGSIRNTSMIFMNNKLNLTPEEMKRLTFHRSDVLQQEYLLKDIRDTQQKYNHKLQKLFPIHL